MSDEKSLESEAKKMSQILKGKVVKLCARHRSNEVVVIFEDGTKLFVDSSQDIEVSIT